MTTTVHKEASSLLRQNSKHIRPLEASFQNLHQAALKSDTLLVGLEGSILMKSFVDAFNKFVDFVGDAERLLVATLEEEVSGLGNASSIGPKTRTLCATLPKWRESLAKIQSRVAMIVTSAERGGGGGGGKSGGKNDDDKENAGASLDRQTIFVDLLESCQQVLGWK